MKVFAIGVVVVILWLILPKVLPAPVAKTEPPKQQEIVEVEAKNIKNESSLDWESNPNGCDLSSQWIAEEAPHYCIDKAKSVLPVLSGSKEDWMRAAGIPESEWWAVDYVITRESSWNPNAVNPTSGACGLVQALPCSKIPGDWSDPVNALKWGERYVNSRYGSWAGAVEFWRIHNWY